LCKPEDQIICIVGIISWHLLDDTIQLTKLWHTQNNCQPILCRLTKNWPILISTKQWTKQSPILAEKNRTCWPTYTDNTDKYRPTVSADKNQLVSPELHGY